MKMLWKIIKGFISVVLFLILLVVLFQKFTDSKITIGNIYIFQVATSSMVPDYQVGDVIIVKKENLDNIEIGDDITYLGKASSVKDLRITHRVVKKRQENNEYYFTTKGIANEIEDPEIKGDSIYGKVVYKTFIFSFLGRLMTNILWYYIIFIVVGVSISYDIISSHFIKED